MINGIINIYKEKGYTSHDVVAKMRGILKIKKIGHTGTLDPEAEGVLPVCIGKATKLVDMITDKDKTYEAVLKLGIVTDTQDLTGKVIRTSEMTAALPEIEQAVRSFIGGYEQSPPMYSAIKVNGRKLYELARQGKEIERQKRHVDIRDIRILNYNENDKEVSVSVDCGKGTYIRTLLNDIGEMLGCGGSMKSLIRTRVGSFKVSEAIKLSRLEELVRTDKLSGYIIPTDEMFAGYIKITVNNDKLVHNGNAFYLEHVKKSQEQGNIRETEKSSEEFVSDNIIHQADISGIPDGSMIRVYDFLDEFIGIYRFDVNDLGFFPVKMFL